jgi:WD40 repeat protein/biotin carboxyl carrier protein
MRRLMIFVVAGVIVSGLAVWWMNSGTVRSNSDSKFVEKQFPAEPETSAKEMILANLSGSDRAFYDPLVIAPCNLVPVSEQDVSSQVDGVFDAIHVALGQHVDRGDLLGKLDDRQLQAQVESLEIRAASTAAERIAQAQFDEAESKVRYALKANESGLTTVPELEYKTYLFQRERFAQEIKKAREERDGAQKELDRARVVLGLHAIRSALGGEIVKIYKRNGEAVKQAEPLFRIANCQALRIEGLCKVQQANLIRVGMRALVEPELRGEQMTSLVGHTGAINAIAISADGRLIASASDDHSVILWSWPGGDRVGSLPHPAEVTAVAFAGSTQDGMILTGCTDGQVRLWRLSQGKAHAPLVFDQGHEGSVRTVAFRKDGAECATGGDDKRIGIWDVAGKHRYWLAAGEGMPAHQGAVTSVHFTPEGHLVSAGRDNVIKVWWLDGAGSLLAVHPGRAGDVANLDVSPDGRRILLDMGEELRILDRGNGTRMGSLQNQKQGRFQNFAQFSSSGRLLFTASSNSRLQLWRVPASAEEGQFLRQGYASGFHRSSLLALSPMGADLNVVLAAPILAPKLWQLAGQEIRHFVVPSGAAIHSGVFAPDESVVFTGGTDRVVRVWAVPAASQWNQSFEATITYVGGQVERGTDMVRIRAEMSNSDEADRRLRAGLFAVMRLFPETAALK